MGRRAVVALVAAAAALVVVVAVVLVVRDDAGSAGSQPSGTASSQPSGTAPAPTTAPQSRAFDVYLAVGDSLAAGYQPTNPGDRTDPEGGYAGRVRDGLSQLQGSTPELVNVGCSGETVVTLVEGGRCEYADGSQLGAAESVLAQQPDEGARTLVTVQVGANDVQRCVVLDAQAPAVDEQCVATGLDAVRSGLPEVLSRITAAAPQAQVVVLDYYNPFVVAALLGPAFEPLAVRSVEVQDALNAEITAAAADAGAAVADVAGPFAAVPAGATDGPTVGPVCSLTWMCADPPDIHASDAGYAVIADEVLRTLGAG